jgi:hypothetical protein
MYETKMYRGTQIGDSHTTVFADAELSTFNFALGYSVSWNSRCVWRGCLCLYDGVFARCTLHEQMYQGIFCLRSRFACVIDHF